MFLIGCEENSSYFPLNEGTVLNYKILFVDKEDKSFTSKQTYTYLKKKNYLQPIIGNTGQIVFYFEDKSGILRREIKYFKTETINNFEGKKINKKKFSFSHNSIKSKKNHYVLKYPLEIGSTWSVNDITRVKMKIGFDKIFETKLPFILDHQIVSKNETIRVSGKKYKNCLKVVGKGETSYNAGPPLGNINIKVKTISWFAKGTGLVKTIRTESSDSQIIGKIVTTKFLE